MMDVGGGRREYDYDLDGLLGEMSEGRYLRRVFDGGFTGCVGGECMDGVELVGGLDGGDLLLFVVVGLCAVVAAGRATLVLLLPFPLVVY